MPDQTLNRARTMSFKLQVGPEQWPDNTGTSAGIINCYKFCVKNAAYLINAITGSVQTFA